MLLRDKSVFLGVWCCTCSTGAPQRPWRFWAGDECGVVCASFKLEISKDLISRNLTGVEVQDRRG